MEIVDRIKDRISKLPELLAEHRIVIAVCGGALLIILVLLLILFYVRHSASKKALEAGQETDAQLLELVSTPGPAVVSPQEFFLPDEPDFVPDILLEREPREGWSEEDARPYWTDPLEGNEDAWKREINDGVDAMLENVP